MGELPSKRDAVIAVLAETSTAMTVAQIRTVLQHRGWLATDKRASNALQATLTRLRREQTIERVAFGIYRLAKRQ